MQGNVVFFLVAGLIVLVVLVFLVTWTTRQLQRAEGNRAKRDGKSDRSSDGADRSLVQEDKDERGMAPDFVTASSAPDAEMAVSFRPLDESAHVSSATVLVDGGPPEVVAADVADAVPSVADPSVAAAQGAGPDPLSAQRRQERIEAMLRELEIAMAQGPDDGAGGLAEQTPPFVLDQLEAEHAMSSLGEDEVVHLSAYEARTALEAHAESESDLSSGMSSDASGANLSAPDVEEQALDQQLTPRAAGDSRGVVLPDWLSQRLTVPGVLGWLVVWPDGICSSSDQPYDALVIEHFAKLVNQALETARIVGLETAGEVNLRGEEGAIVVAPLTAYGVSTEAFLVVFVEGAQVTPGWLAHPATVDL